MSASTILVNTTNGTEVPQGFVLISANLREVKGSNIAADQKHRNVVIPEFVLGESVPKQFQPVLLDSFYKLAKDYLEVKMEETKRMARELPAADFTIDNLLSFFSRVALSTRLTSESVGAWFDSSATGKAIAAKATAKGLDASAVKKYRDLFCKTASPNHGINPNTCTVLLTLLDESDKESNVYETLAQRWQATITKSQASEVDSL